MARTAEVEGEVLAAVQFTTTEWIALQRRVQRGLARVSMPYCGCRGHLATSSKLTQFFRHYAERTDCEYAAGGESEEHVFAKKEIQAGAIAAGWSGSLERSGGSRATGIWRADVLAVNLPREVAFEVQRSHQTASAYVDRTDKYAALNVECLWFISDDPTNHGILSSLLPVFRVEIGYDSANVIGLGIEGAGGKPLHDFVRDWLGGWRPEVPRPASKASEAEVVHGITLEVAVERKYEASTDRGPADLTEGIQIGGYYDILRPTPARKRENRLPQKPCPKGCEIGMSWSSFIECWVCMTCSLTQIENRP